MERSNLSFLEYFVLLGFFIVPLESEFFVLVVHSIFGSYKARSCFFIVHTHENTVSFLCHDFIDLDAGL